MVRGFVPKIAAARRRPVATAPKAWVVSGLMLFGTAAAAGCGGAQPEPGLAEPAKTGRTRLTGVTTIPVANVAVQKRTNATDRELALADLTTQLGEQLLGPQWARQLDRNTLFGSGGSGWLESDEVVRPSADGPGFTATLSAAQVERVLTQFGQQEPSVDARLPEFWRVSLVAAQRAERQYLVCERKQQWLGVACAMQPPMNERLAVSNLLSELRVEPLLQDGVPVRSDGTSVYPVSVRVTDGARAPISGVPLELDTADGAGAVDTTRAFVPTGETHDVMFSDEHGVCRFAPRVMAVGARVGVELETLLGPLAHLVELPPIPLSSRALAPKRHLVIDLRANDVARTGGFGGLLQRELATAYGVVLPAPARELVTEIQNDPSAGVDNHAALSERLRQLVVEATRGTVDYLVLVAGHSEFASQMGEGRTWYEARVAAKVVEVWSGAVLGEFDESATGAGMGDVAAQQAASTAATTRLAVRVTAALGH